MVHTDYNLPLLITSVIVAIITCFLALSLDILGSSKKQHAQYSGLMVASGLILGLSIWVMHFIGMMASHLPENHYFSPSLTFLSYVIAAVASVFAIWLSANHSLSFSRIIMASILMGSGIAGMHYTGMMGLHVPDYKIIYNPLWVMLSVLLGIVGSIIAFLQIFKAKTQKTYGLGKRWMVACILALSIVTLHYVGMFAVEFVKMGDATVMLHHTSDQKMVAFAILFVISLILGTGLFLGSLELRLDEKNRALTTLNQELADLALQDHLTKLPNRFYLDTYTRRIFVEHQVNGQQITFLYIDVDHFKIINDVFGHYIGDQLLLHIVNRLQLFLNERTQLIRIGGDEFLLIIEQSYLTEAIHTAEQIIESVKREYYIDNREVKASLSIGVAMYPEHGEDLKSLLINADMAMLLSKEQGRNTYRVFNETMDAEKIKSEYQLNNDLGKAIGLGQFELFYQPKFDRNYQICGTEALIRWYHPERGMVSPLQFIDMAEKSGLIVPLGYWVVEQACKQLQYWRDENILLYPVSINLSARQFEHHDLGSTLRFLLNKYKINPKNLIVEITESTILRQGELSVKSFDEIRDMGIQIAIDDFGTGYSSFSYLKDFPFDELKIDKEFVTNLTKDSKEEAILESIIQLAIKLGLRVTAEGVETKQQAEILLRLGCHQLQGFLLGRPMAAQALENYQPPSIDKL